MVGMQIQGAGSPPEALRHTSWVSPTYSAKTWLGPGHTPIPTSGETAPCTRARKEVANHLVKLPCFTGEEIGQERESDLPKVTQPMLHRDGFGTQVSWLPFQAQGAKSPDNLHCPSSLRSTAYSPPKHTASRGCGPDLEEGAPAKAQIIWSFFNTRKLTSGLFISLSILISPAQPTPPAQEREPSTSHRGRPRRFQLLQREACQFCSVSSFCE